MAAVVLKNVAKRYDSLTILENINLDINHSEFVVFVGPSGCGKSTLLRLIAGLTDLSDGDIYIDKKKVNDVPPVDRRIAMVFQSYALYPHMTVFENMSFSLRMSKEVKEVIEKKVMKAARILQLENLLDRKPKNLSGGQRQRVAIGRAIVRQPEVFLFDEPLSNLDAELRVEMRVELSRLHQQLTTTMIYVTHDQMEAMTMADKIVVLHDGGIQQIGTPLQLYHYPRNRFVAGFIGSPRMNFLKVRARSNAARNRVAIDLEGKRLSLPIAGEGILKGDKLVLGIRPKHLNIKTKADLAVKARTDVVEKLGGISYAYLTMPSGDVVTAELSDDISLAVKDKVSLSINAVDCHLFDQTGAAYQRLTQFSTK